MHFTRRRSAKETGDNVSDKPVERGSIQRLVNQATTHRLVASLADRHHFGFQRTSVQGGAFRWEQITCVLGGLPMLRAHHFDFTGSLNRMNAITRAIQPRAQTLHYARTQSWISFVQA